jgi:lipoprotein-anchoring transpeptidase ErfK/SrfK
MSFRVIGGAIALAALVCCVAVGFAVTRTSSQPADTGLAARQRTEISLAKSRAALAAGLKIAPATGATSVAPDTPIVVTAGTGVVSDVRVTSSDGPPVEGEFSVGSDQWHSTVPLAYGTEYRVAATVATVVAHKRVQAESTATFQTLTPSATVTASVWPTSGLHVGVGQPIVFRFSREITSPEARASLLKHLLVIKSRPVTAGWHWFSNRELHFRPQKFWPTGVKVDVGWNLTGWNAGGSWGEGTGASHFDIGNARVSYADLETHLMIVTENGRKVATFPISGGKPTDPTMGGVHIVMDRASVVRMNSATNGVPVDSPDGYDEIVYSNVHISDTGEYVHAAPWSVSSQGRANVSHGCINLGAANAKAFMDFSRVGDIVVVTGTPRPPKFGDHGVMDWDTPWALFTPESVAFQPTNVKAQPVL